MVDGTDNTAAQESDLIKAVQIGSNSSFEQLIDLHLDHLRAFIALKLPAPHLVNEIAHETFVFAYRNIANFQPGTSFRAWTRAIAANLIRAEIQRFSRDTVNQAGLARQQLIEREIADAGRLESPEVEFLERCVEELPEGMKELLRLRYDEDLPIETMAKNLARTETSIWQALFRLRKQLKMCVEGRLSKGTL